MAMAWIQFWATMLVQPANLGGGFRDSPSAGTVMRAERVIRPLLMVLCPVYLYYEDRRSRARYRRYPLGDLWPPCTDPQLLHPYGCASYAGPRLCYVIAKASRCGGNSDTGTAYC